MPGATPTKGLGRALAAAGVVILVTWAGRQAWSALSPPGEPAAVSTAPTHGSSRSLLAKSPILGALVNAFEVGEAATDNKPLKPHSEACALRMSKWCNATTDPFCGAETSGYINYMTFYDCSMASVHWLAWIGMVLWLIFMLYALGDTADVFFCPALDVIVDVLKVPPNLAGVTFLSFGNGAPDVFASLAASLSGQIDTGVAAILGAGMFVTTVVVGCVALASDVKLNRRPFLRDVGFYILATIYLMIMFADNTVNIGEAIGFLIIYATFAVVVVVGRQIYQSRKKSKGQAAEDESGAGDAGEGLLANDHGEQAAPPPPPSRPPTRAQRSLSGDFHVAVPTSARQHMQIKATDHDEQQLAGTFGGGGGGAAAAGALAASAAGANEVPDIVRTKSQRLAMAAYARDNRRKQRRSLLPTGQAAILGGNESTGAGAALAGGRTRRGSFDAAAAAAQKREELALSGHHFEAHSSHTHHGLVIGSYHAPVGMLEAHQRRVERLVQAVHEAEDLQQPVQIASLNMDVPPRDLESGKGEEGADEEEGETALWEQVLNWILLPATLIRQVSVPLLTEEDYDWRFAAASPFLGIPLFWITMVQSIGDPPSAFVASFIHPEQAGVLSQCLLSFLLGAAIAGLAFYMLPRNAPPRGWLMVLMVLIAFLTSVSWIIIVANEVVSILEAMGLILGVPTPVLGLTILAWGNSLGDLVADISVAKAGEPKMAIAATYAGPLFNLLMGLGLSLTVGTAQAPDGLVPLQTGSNSLVWTCFGGLLVSLVSSTVVVVLSNFTIPPWWGYVLFVQYVVFLGVSFYFTFAS